MLLLRRGQIHRKDLKENVSSGFFCCVILRLINLIFLSRLQMVFEGLWSSATHPKDFPTNLWLTHFSDVIGATHTKNFSFWGEGQIASDGLRQVAEWGSARGLEAELRSKVKSSAESFFCSFFFFFIEHFLFSYLSTSLSFIKHEVRAIKLFYPNRSSNFFQTVPFSVQGQELENIDQSCRFMASTSQRKHYIDF